MIKQILCFAFCLLCFGPLAGQATYQEIARDTIVQVPGFLGRTYLLDGKRLNLPVMEWFMSDYSEARERVRVAVLTDQLSIVSYTIGGLMGFAGILVRADNRGLSDDLFTISGIGLGGGITLQIISGSFQRKAVRSYNNQIQTLYQQQHVGYAMQMTDKGLTLILHFD